MNYVSLDASHLYREGGYYDDDVPFTSLREKAGKSEVIAEVFPPYAYTRSLPTKVICADDRFAHDLLTHYETVNAVYNRGAATALVRYQDCIVQGRVLYVPDEASNIAVYETQRQNDRTATASHETAATSEAVTQRFSSEECKFLYIAGAGSFNYGHWIVDDLPRIAAFPHLRAGGKRVIIVLPSFGRTIDCIRSQSLKLLLSDETDFQVLWLDFTTPYYFDELFYVTPPSYHPGLKSPEAINNLVVKAVRNAKAEARASKRIYVPRPKQKGRQIINEVAVASFLHEHGFTEIDVMKMTFKEQVIALSDAEIVVGVMGAAMTNSIFAPSGAKLVYLAPQGWVEPFYWDLAHARSHSYSVVYGSCRDPASSPPDAEFEISLDSLRALLFG